MQGRRLGEELMGQMAGESSTIGCTVVKYSETGEPTLRTFRTSTPEDVKSLKWSRYPTEASVLTWVHPKQTDALEAIAVMKAENGALTKFLEAEGHELGGDMEIKALRPSDRADHRNQLAKTQAAKKFSHSTLTQGRTNAAWKFMYENNEEEVSETFNPAGLHPLPRSTSSNIPAGPPDIPPPHDPTTHYSSAMARTPSAVPRPSSSTLPICRRSCWPSTSTAYAATAPS